MPPIAELPVTFGGLARYNVANALAAAAAADALGLSAARDRRRPALLHARQRRQPRRLNLYERRGRLVLIDFAHNEAGLTGLLEVARQLVTRRRRGKVRLAVAPPATGPMRSCTAWGCWPGSGADDVVICEKPHYLRGRDLECMNADPARRRRRGGFRGTVEAYPSRAERAAGAARAARRRGDVVAVMTHVERTEIADWLASKGFTPVPLARLRELLASEAQASISTSGSLDADRRRSASSRPSC